MLTKEQIEASTEASHELWIQELMRIRTRPIHVVFSEKGLLKIKQTLVDNPESKLNERLVGIFKRVMERPKEPLEFINHLFSTQVVCYCDLVMYRDFVITSDE